MSEFQILTLTCASTQGLWAWWEQSSPSSWNLRSAATWTDSDSTGLQQAMSAKLHECISKADRSMKSLNALLIHRGPGAFTGLRLSASFGLGLATSLKIPAYSVGTDELYPAPTFISLRPQLTKNYTLEECRQKGFEFLDIHQDGQTTTQPHPNSLVLGTKETPYWPTPVDFQNFLQKHSSPTLWPPFKDISYGLEPKIFGVRQNS